MINKASPQGGGLPKKAISTIQQAISPLSPLGCVQFCHDMTFENGEIAMLMNDEKLLEHYYHHQKPAICTDENGRTLKPGIYLLSALKEKHKQVAAIMPKLPLAEQAVHIAINHEDHQEFFSFFFDLSEHDFLHFLLNNPTLLPEFIDNYHRKNANLICEVKDKSNRLILPLSNGESFIDKSQQQRILHQQSQEPIYLSTQQSICLEKLTQGKTSKYIAREMQLSPRTVEHYLERIKRLLGCKTSKELIAVYGEQLPKYGK
jgi:DNA-binding CsgD family transcriptional regulator